MCVMVCVWGVDLPCVYLLLYKVFRVSSQWGKVKGCLLQVVPSGFRERSHLSGFPDIKSFVEGRGSEEMG